MNKRKYPSSLFIIGFVTNVLFHFFWLFVPAVILLIVGIFIKPCLYIGIAVFKPKLLNTFSMSAEFLKPKEVAIAETFPPIDNLTSSKLVTDV